VTPLNRNIHAGQVAPVSADRGDADVTLQVGRDVPVQIFATPLSANRTVTLSETEAFNGATFRIVRSGLGPGDLDVGGLAVLAANGVTAVEVMFDGGAWRYIGYSL
jgi:hypothetical protein